VVWGSSIADLVGAHPGGEHFFAVGGGVRDYALPDEKSLFGIPRGHMMLRYFLDETGSGSSVALTFPYEQREKLLGSLVLSFGSYQSVYTKGISTFYSWRRDDGVGMVVRETWDPSYGILELSIGGPNSELSKGDRSDCAPQATSQKAKR
jgi:hypothetical protein